MIIENNIIMAETGRALVRKGEQSPTTITRVSLASWDSTNNWEDCDYGEREIDGDATEADKDAALETLGVDMTEG